MLIDWVIGSRQSPTLGLPLAVESVGRLLVLDAVGAAVVGAAVVAPLASRSLLELQAEPKSSIAATRTGGPSRPLVRITRWRSCGGDHAPGVGVAAVTTGAAVVGAAVGLGRGFGFGLGAAVVVGGSVVGGSVVGGIVVVVVDVVVIEVEVEVVLVVRSTLVP